MRFVSLMGLIFIAGCIPHHSKIPHASDTPKLAIYVDRVVPLEKGLQILYHIHNISQENIHVLLHPYLNVTLQTKSEKDGQVGGFVSFYIPMLNVGISDVTLLRPRESHNYELSYTVDVYFWPEPGNYEARLI
jgi:hypothetical protein